MSAVFICKWTTLSDCDDDDDDDSRANAHGSKVGLFGDDGSNGAISGRIKCKMATGGHFEKSNGHISEMHYLIALTYYEHFALGLYDDC